MISLISANQRVQVNWNENSISVECFKTHTICIAARFEDTDYGTILHDFKHHITRSQNNTVIRRTAVVCAETKASASLYGRNNHTGMMARRKSLTAPRQIGLALDMRRCAIVRHQKLG